jgi:hypothetical protein
MSRWKIHAAAKINHRAVQGLGEFDQVVDAGLAACVASRNVGFCKLKLKRFGGLDLLKAALDAVRHCGMELVLGDGLSIELGCWMEACVAVRTIRNAGEFNGFLKPRERLFAEPLQFAEGNLVLTPGFRPAIDRVAGPDCRHLPLECIFEMPQRAGRGLARKSGEVVHHVHLVVMPLGRASIAANDIKQENKIRTVDRL